MKRFILPAVWCALALISPAGRAAEPSGEPRAAIAAEARHVSAEFTYRPPADTAADLREVTVAADFNGWSAFATPLTKSKDGVFRAKVRLPAGRHQWRLVINGSWVQDMSTIADRFNPRAERYPNASDGGKNAESTF